MDHDPLAQPICGEDCEDWPGERGNFFFGVHREMAMLFLVCLSHNSHMLYTDRRTQRSTSKGEKTMGMSSHNTPVKDSAADSRRCWTSNAQDGFQGRSCFNAGPALHKRLKYMTSRGPFTRDISLWFHSFASQTGRTSSSTRKRLSTTY